MLNERELKIISDALESFKKEEKCKENKLQYWGSLKDLPESVEFLLTDLYIQLCQLNRDLSMITPNFVLNGEVRFILDGKLITLNTTDYFDLEEYILPHNKLWLDIEDFENENDIYFAYDINKKRVINLWTGNPCMIIDEEVN